MRKHVFMRNQCMQYVAAIACNTKGNFIKNFWCACMQLRVTRGRFESACYCFEINRDRLPGQQTTVSCCENLICTFENFRYLEGNSMSWLDFLKRDSFGEKASVPWFRECCEVCGWERGGGTTLYLQMWLVVIVARLVRC